MEDHSWMLKDLGSANGTWINGQRIDRIANLKLGDQIRVGRTILVFGAQPGVRRGGGGGVRLTGAGAVGASVMPTGRASGDSLGLAVAGPAGGGVVRPE